MKSPCILLIIVCTLSLTGCASTKQADADSSLGKAQQTLDSLYQHYSAKDSYLLRENYPFNEQYKVTYLASENQTNMPNQFSYLWPYSGTFSAVNSLLEATHDKKYQQLLEKTGITRLGRILRYRKNSYCLLIVYPNCSDLRPLL